MGTSRKQGQGKKEGERAYSGKEGGGGKNKEMGLPLLPQQRRVFRINFHDFCTFLSWSLDNLVCICSCANSLEVNLITKLSTVSLQLHENEYLRYLPYKRTIDCDLPINSLPCSRVCVVAQRSSPSIRTLKRSVAWQGRNGFVAWETSLSGAREHFSVS